MKTDAEKIEVMQAHLRGEKIEYKPPSGNWYVNERPQWDWPQCDYRIAPKVPRRIWVNQINNCFFRAWDNEKMAIEDSRDYAINPASVAVEFVEVLKD